MTAIRQNAFAGNALHAAQTSFHYLMSGPCPLTIDGTVLGHGLPARLIDLGEVKDLLLDRQASDALKDVVWAELVRQARAEGPAWVVGCLGVAMPGLKNLTARTTRGCPPDLVDDIVSELVTEFVAQLGRIDITRRNIAPRLLLWARKGALRARGREFQQVNLEALELPAAPAETDPVCVLVEAVRVRVLSPAAAELINATRLQGQTLRDYARGLGAPADRLYKQRRTAETRLASAIAKGQVSVNLGGPGSEPGA